MITTGTNYYANDGTVIAVESRIGELQIVERDDRIEIRIENHGDVVNIYKPRVRFGQMILSEVNWSAIGSQPAAVADTMAFALNVAVDLARRLDKETNV